LRSTSRLLPLIMVVACARPSSRAMARQTAETEVRQAERQRFEAMRKQDVAALDTLLDEDLTYVHIGSTLQSRKQFVDMIGKGTVVYESIEPSNVRVRVHEGLALVTGRSRQRLRDATGARTFGMRFTEVYVRRGGRWLLTAWEATRIKST
jgi:ketosteroid isomerase-like protein